MYQDLGIPMKIEMQSDSSTEFFNGSIGSRTANEARVTRGTFGYKNEFKTETSESRRWLQQRTAQMLERNQSLLQYCGDIASLQDWYSIDHGSHTPQQDEG